MTRISSTSAARNTSNSSFPSSVSSMTRWRDRIGPQGLEKVFQESLGVAHRTGALRTKDLRRVTVDTTVQEKAITFPTDAKLMHKARQGLVRLAKAHGVPLRQSYVRVGKRALIMQGATATPSSTSGRARRCASSGPISGAPSATSAARRPMTRICGISSDGPCGWASACSPRNVAIRCRRCIRCTRRRSSASARARRTSPTSSGARSRWRRPTTVLQAASSSPT